MVETDRAKNGRVNMRRDDNMEKTTLKWDVQNYLDSPESIAGYLEAAFEEGDLAFIRTALNDVTRATGMSKLERETGLTRATLYKAFGDNGNPTLETLMKVTKALGVRLAIAA
jgi:probable addiction module antidote protein